MHLLCFLAANSGLVVTREQLSNELWPQVIVTDNSLTRAISELRKQLQPPLQESGCRKDYLQTVPKRGYRLLLPVGTITPRDDLETTGWIAGIPLLCGLARPGVRRGQALLAACLVSSWLSFSYWSASHEPAAGPSLADFDRPGDRVITEQQPLQGRLVSLSTLNSFDEPAGQNRTVAISPDGSTVAFLRYEYGLSRLYMAEAGSDGGPLVLFSSEDYLYNLQWSPVGNAILFARQPATVSTTLLDAPRQSADLVMLDIDTLTLKTLIDNTPEPAGPGAAV
jgi:hypothetical protein